MSNTKRPSTQRKSTRASRTRAREGLERGVSLTIKADGEDRTYTVRDGDLTGEAVFALRRETGYSFAGLQQALATDPDIDLLGVFVWLARRLQGDPAPLSEVLAEIDYDVDFDFAEPSEEDDAGEA